MKVIFTGAIIAISNVPLSSQGHRLRTHRRANLCPDRGDCEGQPFWCAGSGRPCRRPLLDH
jgi:hypothetical protein